jgi:catechol 2,3-dioxygenase-like lactoylglutathione lyase family enzyme
MKISLRLLIGVLLQLTVFGSKAQEKEIRTLPITKIAHVTILVKDYDEALKFYTQTLGFEKRSDVAFGTERWVTVSPSKENEMEFVFVQPSLQEDREMIGRQAGSRTFVVIHTSNCKQLIEHYRGLNVHITAEPVDAPWGTQAQIRDLYGNNFVLLEPRRK